MIPTKYQIGDQVLWHGEPATVRGIDVREHGEPDYVIEYEGQKSIAQECELEVGEQSIFWGDPDNGQIYPASKTERPEEQLVALSHLVTDRLLSLSTGDRIKELRAIWLRKEERQRKLDSLWREAEPHFRKLFYETVHKGMILLCEEEERWIEEKLS